MDATVLRALCCSGREASIRYWRRWLARPIREASGQEAWDGTRKTTRWPTEETAEAAAMKTRKLKRGWWRRLWSRNAQEDVEREIGWSQYRLEGWLGYRAAVAGLRFDLRVRHVFSRLEIAISESRHRAHH